MVRQQLNGNSPRRDKAFVRIAYCVLRIAKNDKSKQHFTSAQVIVAVATSSAIKQAKATRLRFQLRRGKQFQQEQGNCSYRVLSTAYREKKSQIYNSKLSICHS